MTAISSLTSKIDSILGVRATIGAVIQRVYLITRTWSGSQIGDGTVTETSVEVLPSPGVRSYSHSINIMNGGVIKQGDLLIHLISKNTFPLESNVDCLSTSASVEKIYKIGAYYYRAVSVVESYLTWNVQVRRMSDQTRRDAIV